MPTDPHPEFTQALHEAYRRTRIEAQYNAPYFLSMLHERHGLATAEQLLSGNVPKDGFTRLWERKRLDLSVEAIVLQPQWQNLFSCELLTIAHSRLQQYGYQFPADSWKPAQ